MQRLPFHQIIAGVDEAGRGPLAGPVVAAAVILGTEFDLAGIGLTDSKKLTEAKREELFPIIKENCDYGVGIVSPKDIDKLNILQATFKAMKIAINKLTQKPELILIDGNKTIPGINGIPQTAIVKGDLTESSISAASIIAKVTRDHLMLKYHAKYPQYNYAKHKGYPTVEHKRLLDQYGASPIQRKSFSY